MTNIEAVTGGISHLVTLKTDDNKASMTLQDGTEFSVGSANDNSHLRSLMLLGNLLPSLPVHVAIDDGLGDRSHMQPGKLPFYP